MFVCSKPKIGCSSLFDVRKNYVRVSSISNLVNLVKALSGSMFVRSMPKMGVQVRSPIVEHFPVRSMFENDVQVHSMFDKMVFNPSLDIPKASKFFAWSYRGLLTI